MVPLLGQIRHAQHVKIRPTIKPAGAASKAVATVQFPTESALAGSVTIDTLAITASSLWHLREILFLEAAAAGRRPESEPR